MVVLLAIVAMMATIAGCSGGGNGNENTSNFGNNSGGKIDNNLVGNWISKDDNSAYKYTFDKDGMGTYTHDSEDREFEHFHFKWYVQDDYAIIDHVHPSYSTRDMTSKIKYAINGNVIDIIEINDNGNGTLRTYANDEYPAAKPQNIDNNLIGDWIYSTVEQDGEEQKYRSRYTYEFFFFDDGCFTTDHHSRTYSKWHVEGKNIYMYNVNYTENFPPPEYSINNGILDIERDGSFVKAGDKRAAVYVSSYLSIEEIVELQESPATWDSYIGEDVDTSGRVVRITDLGEMTEVIIFDTYGSQHPAVRLYSKTEDIIIRHVTVGDEVNVYGTGAADSLTDCYISPIYFANLSEEDIVNILKDPEFVAKFGTTVLP